MSHPTFELDKLDPNTFEHLVNALAIKVLGAGHTGFGPGRDGGRDGYFQGKAPYPSVAEQWDGRWYIQSKFMLPVIGKNPQTWLVSNIQKEIEAFENQPSDRVWPDNWIIATNVEPSGASTSGSFDKALALVTAARPQLANRFHIWGGSKILALLSQHPEILASYSQFLSSGHVLSKLYQQLSDATASVTDVLRYLIVTQLVEQQYTKLEQAGSTADARPGIERLFTDLPFAVRTDERTGLALAEMVKAAAQNFGVNDYELDNSAWREWLLAPSRSRIWFIKGGPGQGKSTLTQYIAQIQRAAFILGAQPPRVLPAHREIATRVKDAAVTAGFWPAVARIPFTIELKEFAQWYGRLEEGASRRVLSYLAHRLTQQIGQEVLVGTLKRALTESRWLFIFDGLDEVPGDVKDGVAEEIVHFSNDVLVGCNADAFVVCTSRPQGYSGQFSGLNASAIELEPLSREQAIACATPVLFIDRPQEEAQASVELLREAIQSRAVAEIMTTPLQSHIMAVVVREGGKPPERRWLLFSNFFQTIKRREANKNSADKRIATLLRKEDKLIKSLHNRLGFELHARAEKGEHAVTSLNRDEFRILATEVVRELKDNDVEQVVSLLMEAATERLVLVNTPDSGSAVRFDIRPLQEFFAAEYLYESVDPKTFSERVQIISGDSHWREVLHFLLSGLIENDRRLDLQSAVNVLQHLDTGFDSQTIRTFSRRLALGSLTATRLILEGVLEQDRRIRSMFRDSLRPILACTDAITHVPNLGPTDSAAWFSAALADCLKEQSEAENIGAGIIAMSHLPDSFERLEDVVLYFLNASQPYKRALLELARKRFVTAVEPRPVPTWFLCVVLKLLVRPSWTELGSSTIEDAVQILQASKVNIKQAALQVGFSQTLADAMPLCFAPPAYSGTHPTSERINKDVFGVLQESFSEEITFRCETVSAAVLSEMEGIGGIFGAIFHAMKFISLRDDVSAQALIGALKQDRNLVMRLPDCVSLFFDPKNDGGSMSDWLRKENAGRERHFMFNYANAEPDWAGLLANLPYFAWHFLAELTEPSRSASFRKFLNTDEGGKCLLSIVQDDPAVLVCSPESWEECFSLPNVGPQLRKIAIDFAAKNQRDNISSRVHVERNLGRFRLHLPDEAALLPQVADFLAEVAWMRRPFERNRFAGTRKFREGVATCFPDYKKLEEIVNNSQLPKRQITAAILMSIAHPDNSNVSWTDVSRDIVRQFDVTDASWLLRVASAALNDAIVQGNVEATALMSNLFELCRSDFRARISFDRILRNWREITRAPVENSQQLIWKSVY